MTITTWLTQAQQKLKENGIETGRLDALVLLEDRLGKSRAHLLAHPELELSSVDKNVLNRQITHRALHTPLAYVRKKTEFYGRNFIVTPAVLEPRPESETMITLLKTLLKAPSTQGLDTRPDLVRIADIGTGSGALGITAKLELPWVLVDLLEVDDKALKIAEMNVVLHTIDISVMKSDLLSSTSHSYDVLLCNLPYVPDDFHINRAATHEPKLAIFGGPDGLGIYRRLFQSLHLLHHLPLYILTEALPPQHQMLAEIAKDNGYKLHTTDDFIQVFTPA